MVTDGPRKVFPNRTHPEPFCNRTDLCLRINKEENSAPVGVGRFADKEY